MFKNYLFVIIVLFLGACARKTEVINNYSNSDSQNASIAKLVATEKDPEAAAKLQAKLMAKLAQGSLVRVNEGIIKSVEGHTKLYRFTGKYKVLVIPVQFADTKMADADFFKNKAQDYIFGSGPNTMASFYKHASMGKFHLEGEVAPIITVDHDLKSYGEAVTGSSDKNAKGLVVDALEKLKEIKSDKSWWNDFDNWDVNDYDNDKNFHEPDGFIDAVVLIYAGKDQASCQRSFDTEGKRPASSEVPAGPRHDSAVECFNRIWPHRWAVSLSQDDPRYNEKGPLVEGQERPAMNGLKINDELFALDYNMQSEFSDISTFCHEFGHSLTLPDVYSMGEDNSTGSWELMSQNANLQGQEFSSYSKLSLGWLSPKAVKQGEQTSLYLGAYNFVAKEERESAENFLGPTNNSEGDSILSTVPEYDEDVYRSLIVLTNPSTEIKKVVDVKEQHGHLAAYSGKFDDNSRSLKLKLKVPADGNDKLTFDTIYQLETETSFDSTDDEIKVVTEFDIGKVMINGNTVEVLKLLSGDSNYDSLAEQNASCEAEEVLRLRNKKNHGGLSDVEKLAFKEKTELCRKAVWVKKSYDVSAFKGQEVELEIRYKTDAGYTEFGIVVDNIALGDQKIDFENSPNMEGGFALLADGKEKINYNQFYLMEYRTPGENYVIDNNVLSYNMDNNIDDGVQSYFLSEGNSLQERFRMVTYDYRPGLVVWYFNSKYDRRTNDPAQTEGKGYLLVLNSKIKEVPLPGIFAESRFFDENFQYREEEKWFKDYLKDVRELFACYTYSDYYTYINGEAPAKCEQVDRDHLKTVTFDGKPLVYRRERFNELLPLDRYKTVAIDQPFRNYTGMRTGLSTFNPASEKEFSPFKVYKEIEGKMVLDQEATDLSAKFKSVDSFDDKDSSFTPYKRFQGDTVVVEKTGLKFKVVSPSSRVISQYKKDIDGADNSNWFRRPRVKIYLDWSRPQATN